MLKRELWSSYNLLFAAMLFFAFPVESQTRVASPSTVATRTTAIPVTTAPSVKSITPAPTFSLPLPRATVLQPTNTPTATPTPPREKCCICKSQSLPEPSLCSQINRAQDWSTPNFDYFPPPPASKEEACNGVLTASGKRDCVWKSDNHGGGQCTSRFKSLCEKWVETSKDLGCTRSIAMGEGAPVNGWLLKNNCGDDIEYKYHGHGPNCDASLGPFLACVECLPSDVHCQFVARISSCSVFQDLAAVRDWAERIRLLLAARGGGSAVITANQANMTPDCYSAPLRLSVTAAGYVITYPDCADLDDCLRAEQVVSCAENGEIKQRICCRTDRLRLGQNEFLPPVGTPPSCAETFPLPQSFPACEGGKIPVWSDYITGTGAHRDSCDWARWQAEFDFNRNRDEANAWCNCKGCSLQVSAAEYSAANPQQCSTVDIGLRYYKQSRVTCCQPASNRDNKPRSEPPDARDNWCANASMRNSGDANPELIFGVANCPDRFKCSCLMDSVRSDYQRKIAEFQQSCTARGGVSFGPFDERIWNRCTFEQEKFRKVYTAQAWGYMQCCLPPRPPNRAISSGTPVPR